MHFVVVIKSVLEIYLTIGYGYTMNIFHVCKYIFDDFIFIDYFPENTAPRSQRNICAPMVPPVLPPIDFPIDRPSSHTIVLDTLLVISPPTPPINVGVVSCAIWSFSEIRAERISLALSRSISVLYFITSEDTDKSHPSSLSVRVSIRDSGGAIIVLASGVGIHFSPSTVTSASPIPRMRSSSSIL